MSTANPGGAEPVPGKISSLLHTLHALRCHTESSLIYFSKNGKYLPGFNTDASINFVPGKTYRLRIINTSALSMFWFFIEGHEMRIIEVDGTDIQEAPAAMLGLTVAQRYSILVTARNDTKFNWAIHADLEYVQSPSDLWPCLTVDSQCRHVRRCPRHFAAE
jgi:iron transport multicopper oxidase